MGGDEGSARVGAIGLTALASRSTSRHCDGYGSDLSLYVMQRDADTNFPKEA